MSAFAGVPPSGLKFLQTSLNSSDDLPPLVDPSCSHSFCSHHQLIRKILEYIIAVSSDEEGIMEERNQLLSDIQDHLDYLDHTVKYEWLHQQGTDSLDMAAAVQSSVPILVKSGIFLNSFLCTLAEIDRRSLIRCIRVPGLCHLPTAGECHRSQHLTRFLWPFQGTLEFPVGMFPDSHSVCAQHDLTHKSSNAI